jgi:hypothetical protein
MGERLQGFITEQHLEAAEREFPGIGRFYAECATRPRTFLQLMWLYLDAACDRERAA